MRSQHQACNISPAEVSRLASEYSEDLLDEFRFVNLPDILAHRKATGDPILEKEELAKLMQWKLCVCQIVESITDV